MSGPGGSLPNYLPFPVGADPGVRPVCCRKVFSLGPPRLCGEPAIPVDSYIWDATLAAGALRRPEPESEPGEGGGRFLPPFFGFGEMNFRMGN